MALKKLPDENFPVGASQFNWGRAAHSHDENKKQKSYTSNILYVKQTFKKLMHVF